MDDTTPASGDSSLPPPPEPASASIPLTLCLSVLIAMIGMVVWAYPRLPEIIPVHFDIRGEPDRWGTKSVWIFLPMPAVYALTLGMVLVMSRLGRRYPALWNIPYKRRAMELPPAEFGLIFEEVRFWLYFLMLGVGLLLATIEWLIFKAAIAERMASPLWPIGAFVLFAAYLLVRMTLRVRRMVRAFEQRGRQADPARS